MIWKWLYLEKFLKFQIRMYGFGEQEIRHSYIRKGSAGCRRKDFQIGGGYIDSNSLKAGKKFNGKPVILPEQLKEQENVCVLINSIQTDVIEEISSYLNAVGQEWYLMDEVILKSHREEVLQCYDFLDDVCSRNTYAALTLWRLTGRKPEMEIKCEESAYFALDNFRRRYQNEIFIDCGAYTGDTLMDYMEQKKGVFKKIISFEPDRENYKSLEQQVERVKREWGLDDGRIEIYPYGAGARNTEGVFERYEGNMGLGSRFVPRYSEDEEICRIISLDEFLTEPYTFLKADIESFEYQMLLGAEKGIKRYRPLLAVCIYHNAVDFYSVILLIKKMVPQYNLAVRHHSKNLDETVLYAWI